MCDVILQPAPGALQAPGTAHLSLRFNSLAPQHFTSTHCWISFSPICIISTGGRATCWGGGKKNRFQWEQRRGVCRIHLWLFCKNRSLFHHSKNSLSLFLSVSLFLPPPLLCPPLFLGGWRVLLRSDLMGKTQKKEENQKTGNMSGHTGV